MALTDDFVTRTDDTGGKEIRTYTEPGGEHIQAVGLADENGDQLGINARPVKNREPEPSLRYNTGGALENEAQAKGAPGVLRQVHVVLDIGASVRFLHLFNLVGAAAGTPIKRFPIPAGASSITYTPLGGLTFSAGLVVATSSTLAAFTDPSDTVAAFHVEMD